MDLRLLLLILHVARSLASSHPLEEDASNQVDQDGSDVIDFSWLGSNAFIAPDHEVTGKLVAEYNGDSEQNPEELGAYFEGDILLPLRLDGRNGLSAVSSHWAGGVVPYEIKGSFNSFEMAAIEWAFSEYHAKTCIRFKPRTREKDYVSIVNGNTGCWSAVGRMGGKQEVNLQTPTCMLKRGTILHELMHVLGFIHEQNRYERDDYIQVLRQNIKREMLVNFEKSTWKATNGMGVPYDYSSVMHYSPKSFSRNGQPTIVAKKPDAAARNMGQRAGFSSADLHKINLMYKCKNRRRVVKHKVKNTDFIDNGGDYYELEMEYV